MKHLIGCTRKQFVEDPSPLNKVWWHSAFCEGKSSIEEYSNSLVAKGFWYRDNKGFMRKGEYYSDGPSYGEAVVNLIWRIDERSK